MGSNLAQHEMTTYYYFSIKVNRITVYAQLRDAQHLKVLTSTSNQQLDKMSCMWTKAADVTLKRTMVHY